jgi:hypothetical protein
MKVKVIKTFRDKYTKVIYQKGQEIEATKERFEEINSAALGPFIEEVKPKSKESEKKTQRKTTNRKSKTNKT